MSNHKIENNQKNSVESESGNVKKDHIHRLHEDHLGVISQYINKDEVIHLVPSKSNNSALDFEARKKMIVDVVANENNNSANVSNLKNIETKINDIRDTSLSESSVKKPKKN